MVRFDPLRSGRPVTTGDSTEMSRLPPIRIVPFEPAHLLALEPGAHERRWLGGFDIAACVKHWPSGSAWSALAGRQMLGCGGLIADGDTATAWAVLSDRLRARPMALHRAASRALARLAPRFRRIRATVSADFADGHRWLRKLGFRPVQSLANYGPNGETVMEYERWADSTPSRSPSLGRAP